MCWAPSVGGDGGTTRRCALSKRPSLDAAWAASPVPIAAPTRVLFGLARVALSMATISDRVCTAAHLGGGGLLGTNHQINHLASPKADYEASGTFSERSQELLNFDGLTDPCTFNRGEHHRD